MTERSTLQGQPDVPQKKRKALSARRLFLYLIIPLVAFVYIVPAIGVILTSFKLDAEIAETGLWSIPKLIHFDNYKEIWVDANVRTYMKNSALVTIPATAISIMLGVLMGYVFSKLPFKGSEILFIFVLAGMFFPPQIVLVPLIILALRRAKLMPGEIGA